MAVTYDEWSQACRDVGDAVVVVAHPATLRQLIGWIQSAPGVTTMKLDRSKPLPKGIPMMGSHEVQLGVVGLYDHTTGKLQRQFLVANGELIAVASRTTPGVS